MFLRGRYIDSHYRNKYETIRIVLAKALRNKLNVGDGEKVSYGEYDLGHSVPGQKLYINCGNLLIVYKR